MSTTSKGAEHIAQQYDAHAQTREEAALHASACADLFPEDAADWRAKADRYNREAADLRKQAADIRGQQ